MSDDPVLTIRDAADELRVDPSTIRRAILSGKLRAFKVGETDSKYGGTWRIRESALLAYEEACTPQFSETRLPPPVDHPQRRVRRSREAPSTRGSLRHLMANEGGRG